MSYKINIVKQEDYPEKLKNIKNYPKKLYTIGNIELLYKDSFAIIGTRKITDYGKKNCEYSSREFSYRKIPIVSGMALGTDSVSHITAIEYNSYTIAVLGSGFNYIYPEENKALFDNIIENNGLVITEYEENIRPNKQNFPKRNRIISALSEGVLVIEAAYRSGTSITAKLALRQGKKVFAVPRENR